MDMKLGIIGAMEQEVETLLSLMENKVSTTHAGRPFRLPSWKVLPAWVDSDLFSIMPRRVSTSCSMAPIIPNLIIIPPQSG